MPPKHRTNKKKQSKKCAKSTEGNIPLPILPYEVLRKLFTYLSAKDLIAASSVCSVGYELSMIERSRRGIELMISKTNVLRDPQVLSQNIRIKPSFVLCFVEGDKHFSLRRSECFSNYLPNNCPVIYMITKNVDVNNGHKILNVAEKVGFIFIPKEFDIYTTLSTYFYYNEFVKKLENKCNYYNSNAIFVIILSICPVHCSEALQRMSALMRLRSNIKFSMISLVADNLFLYEKEDKAKISKHETHMESITVLSQNDMMSWSVVINQMFYNYDFIVQKLTLLRNTIELKKFTTAIMFGNYNRIHNKEIEVKAFEKVFPNVPLITVHGNRVSGVDTMREDYIAREGFNIGAFLIITYNK